jgi:hypothetical protein
MNNTLPSVISYREVVRVKVLFVMVEGDKSPRTKNIPEDGGSKAPQQKKTNTTERKGSKEEKQKTSHPCVMGVVGVDATNNRKH